MPGQSQGAKSPTNNLIHLTNSREITLLIFEESDHSQKQRPIKAVI